MVDKQRKNFERNNYPPWNEQHLKSTWEDDLFFTPKQRRIVFQASIFSC